MASKVGLPPDGESGRSMHEGSSERPRRYCCTSCGVQASPYDGFCGNCGALLPFATGADSTQGYPRPNPTREIPRPVRGQTGGYGPPSLRFQGTGRDALLGLLLAATCAGLSVAAIYVALAVRGTFPDPDVPGTLGLSLFALLHGGGASLNVPPIPALFGIGGSVRLGLPITSLALVPFLLSLLAGRLLGDRAGTVAPFALAAALAYALVLAALAALGTTSSEIGDVTIRFASDPFSAALRGFLLVGLGTMLGGAASRGTLIPAWVRQVLRGALWSVGVSLAIALVLTVAVVLTQGSGASTPTQQAPQDMPAPPAQPAPQDLPVPQDLPQPSLEGGGSIGDLLAPIGAFFALLPVALGNLWLLAHGVPVGFQNAPDLSGIPLVGETLSAVPLQGALLGDWPLGGAWRVLLVGPIVGLLVGGLVAARGAAPGARWQQGALVALPYTAIVLLTAVLVGASADLTLGEAINMEVAFRASLAWLLLLLPAGAVLGALGGLRSRGDVFPIPRPNRTFVAAALVSGVLVLASLPVFFANFPGSDAQPIRPSASGGQPFASQRAFEEAPSPTATPDLSDTSPPPEEEAEPWTIHWTEERRITQIDDS